MSVAIALTAATTQGKLDIVAVLLIAGYAGATGTSWAHSCEVITAVGCSMICRRRASQVTRRRASVDRV